MFEKQVIRWYMKPRVESDLPGRLRLSFEHFRHLPPDALPYLHYIQDVFQMVDGVREVRINPQIGTLLIVYDKGTTRSAQLLRWLDTAVDTGLQIAKELETQVPVDEKAVEAMARARLDTRLQEMKKAKSC